MAAECEHAGSLHTSYAAAYNGDILGSAGLYYLILGGLHGFGVQCTPCHARIVRERLIVAYAVVVSHVEAGIMAAYAGADVLFPAFHQLGYPLWVGKELAGNAYAVYLTLCYRLRAYGGVHASRADYRYIHELLYVCNVFKVAVPRHIGGGVSPVPCVVCAVVAV